MVNGGEMLAAVPGNRGACHGAAPPAPILCMVDAPQTLIPARRDRLDQRRATPLRQLQCGSVSTLRGIVAWPIGRQSPKAIREMLLPLLSADSSPATLGRINVV
jgi:hypothetical protein